MEKTRNYIRECYESDRNNGIFEAYFHHYETKHQHIMYKGEILYLEMEDGQVAMVYDERDFFYNVIMNDDKFIEMVKNETPIKYINEYLGL